MDEFWTRVIDNLAGRLTTPMQLRLVLQPVMASIFAIRSGLSASSRGVTPVCIQSRFKRHPTQ